MKKTVGQIASELQKSDSGLVNPQEIQRAQEQEYLQNLEWCVKHARKEIDCSSLPNHKECTNRTALKGDFFIASLLKREKLLENVIRNYFVPTQVCPTPCHDQTVFRYNDSTGQIEYIWTVPDEQTALTLKENANIVRPSEHQSLDMVLKYYRGDLMRLCKKFNGETMQSGGLLMGAE